MGPRTNKNFIALALRKKIRGAKEALSLMFFITISFSMNSRPSIYNKNACTVIKYFIYFQTTAVMEAGSFLTPEEAARMGGENPAAAAASAAAAAAAAAAAKGNNTGHSTKGNGPKPATSGFVQTAKCLPSASERSKLIHINRELNNKPTVLGGGGVPPLFLTLRLSTL
jgi:hypothetical protein